MGAKRARVGRLRGLRLELGIPAVAAGDAVLVLREEHAGAALGASLALAGDRRALDFVEAALAGGALRLRGALGRFLSLRHVSSPLLGRGGLLGGGRRFRAFLLLGLELLELVALQEVEGLVLADRFGRVVHA